MAAVFNEKMLLECLGIAMDSAKTPVIPRISHDNAIAGIEAGILEVGDGGVLRVVRRDI